MGLRRATAKQFIRPAFLRGESASQFIRDMKKRGISYSKTVMLADWRSENELIVKEGLMQYVRRDYFPTQTTTAQVTWSLSQEYMYVVKVRSRREPGVPVTERKVNITSDVPMTPRMVEQVVVEKWAEWERYGAEEIEDIIPWAAVHRTG